MFWEASPSEARLAKLDSPGVDLWTVEIGAAGDRVYFVHQTSDGGYIAFAGKLWWGAADFWLVKVDAEQWHYTIPLQESDVIECVSLVPDGSYIISGWSRIHYTFMKPLPMVVVL